MRIAVLSDIHGNVRALDAVLESIGTVDAVWQLGDVVGYGPDPDAVVGRLMDAGAIGVRGNHDTAAVGGDAIDYFNPDARLAMEWTRAHLSAATREWLESQPEIRQEGEFTLVHGSPRDPVWEYVTSRATAEETFGTFDSAYCLLGHTHVPIVFRRGTNGHVEVLGVEDGSRLPLDERRCIVNPGSVGQPRDGEPAASYLILDTDARTATWQRVPYDVESTQAAMEAAGLPARLVRRLTFGY